MMRKLKYIAFILMATMWTSAAFSQEFTEKHKAPEEAQAEDDVTSLAISAGGLINGGNTQSWTVNAGYAFALIRGQHGFTSNGQFAYGRAALIEDLGDGTFARRPWADTTKNALIDARYDFFLSDMDALFLAGKWRWDEFAGLDTRAQAQIGYLRNLFLTKKQRLWTEIGYDLTYDNLHPDPFIDADLSDQEQVDLNCADPDMADPTCYNDEDVVHAARLFAAYRNDLYDNIQFYWATEVLLNIPDFEDVRVNLDLALRASLVERLQLEMKYRMMFDNVPVPPQPGLAERAKADHQFIFSIIYNLL